MSSIQPVLPVREEPKSIEYYPAGEEGDPWAVTDWRGLAERFDLTPGDLLAWHKAMSGQLRPWVLCKRIYGVMAMMGDAVEEDDMQEWDWPRLAKHLAVPEAVLRAEMDAAVLFWKKSRVSLKYDRAAKSGAASADASSAPFQIHQEIPDERIAELLKIFRFGHIKSAEDRVRVANRILELKGLLEDKNVRESARGLIVMESNMADNEVARSLLKSRLDALRKNPDVTDKQSAEIMEITKALQLNEKAYAELMDKYRAAALELGQEEIEGGELRKVALGTFSHGVEAVREFYASGEMVLIDGMFTADELIFLTTPQVMRPAQYRPDIVLRVREAMKPEHLWDPNYSPTKIQREASRRLLLLAKGMVEEGEPVVIPTIDAEVGVEDGEADAVEFPAEIPASAQVPIIPASTPETAESFMAMG